ncbi:hypothetical protein AVEN_255291-1 [Araneus ventricosus]|uniref:Uncharacterized protein n=1 Tax=Araneus ventricosus TaxID=182803 RepID=A0A4Y2BAV2_ARAVE|nr:hypothetical protein AVEN_255291-1 [Araneus ventricosus]
MIMIGSSVDYVRSGGMRNVPVTKAVEHLYATTAKFSECVLSASRPAYSYPPRRLAGAIFANVILMTTVCGWLAICGLSEKWSTLFSWGNVLAGKGKHHNIAPRLTANLPFTTNHDPS